MECNGEVKKHDPHSACQLVQVSIDTTKQVDDRVLNSETGLLGKLKGVKMWSDHGPKQFQDESL